RAARERHGVSAPRWPLDDRAGTAADPRVAAAAAGLAPLADGLDLSGAWDGVYSYPRDSRTVPFVAHLMERAATLTGTTQQTGTRGAAKGGKIGRTRQGRRDARAVTFLKLYDGRHEGYDSVHYEGRLSADGSEIAGRWTIPGGWSGSFLMIRGGGAKAAAEKAT